MDVRIYNDCMKSKHLFLLWNKALYAKDKIINDLNNSFVIEKAFYIKWDKTNFPRNLQSLYGHRLGSPIEKIVPCGKGKFLFLIVEDEKPLYELKELYDGQDTINTNIYKKKELYRKWTGGSNRIHCSVNKEELLHDLVVLFGKDYENVLSSINDYETYDLNTKTITGFKDIDDIKECLNLFGNNVSFERNNNLFVFCKSRVDLEYFLGSSTINNYNIHIFGELEGDLPEKAYQLIKSGNNEISDSIINNIDSYYSFLNTRNNLPYEVQDTFTKNNLNTNFKSVETDRKSSSAIIFKTIKNEIKYLIHRLHG